MKKVATTLGTALFIASAMVHANPVDDLFQGVDSNQDGKISQAEAAINPELEAQFAAIDVNQDGFLTPDEFQVEEAPQSES